MIYQVDPKPSTKNSTSLQTSEVQTVVSWTSALPLVLVFGEDSYEEWVLLGEILGESFWGIWRFGEKGSELNSSSISNGVSRKFARLVWIWLFFGDVFYFVLDGARFLVNHLCCSAGLEASVSNRNPQSVHHPPSNDKFWWLRSSKLICSEIFGWHETLNLSKIVCSVETDSSEFTPICLRIVLVINFWQSYMLLTGHFDLEVNLCSLWRLFWRFPSSWQAEKIWWIMGGHKKIKKKSWARIWICLHLCPLKRCLIYKVDFVEVCSDETWVHFALFRVTYTLMKPSS